MILFDRSTLYENAVVVKRHFDRQQREESAKRVLFEHYSEGVGSDPLVMGVAEKSRKWCQKRVLGNVHDLQEPAPPETRHEPNSNRISGTTPLRSA